MPFNLGFHEKYILNFSLMHTFLLCIGLVDLFFNLFKKALIILCVMITIGLEYRIRVNKWRSTDLNQCPPSVLRNHAKDIFMCF